MSTGEATGPPVERREGPAPLTFGFKKKKKKKKGRNSVSEDLISLFDHIPFGHLTTYPTVLQQL